MYVSKYLNGLLTVLPGQFDTHAPPGTGLALRGTVHCQFGQPEGIRAARKRSLLGLTGSKDAVGLSADDVRWYPTDMDGMVRTV